VGNVANLLIYLVYKYPDLTWFNQFFVCRRRVFN